MSHNLNPKTLSDFGADKHAEGLEPNTMDQIRGAIRGIKSNALDNGHYARSAERGAEAGVAQAQHGVDTCDTVLRQLDKMEGK